MSDPSEPVNDPTSATPVPSTPDRRSGGVFISHVHEDKALADAFALMLRDASAGVLDVFSSSDNTVGAGIRYGSEWFKWITSQIARAEHVVALLTPASVERPWILFEAGLGKAKPGGSVFGLALGMGVAEASRGPFGVFQNSGDDEAQLVKLCRQLMAESQAHPREEKLLESIRHFRETVEAHGTMAPVAPTETDKRPEPALAAVYQQLEDLKFLLDKPTYRREDFLGDENALVILRLVREMGSNIPVTVRAGLLASVAEDLGLNPQAALLRETLGRTARPRNVPAIDYLITEVFNFVRPWSEASDWFLSTARRELSDWIHRQYDAEQRAGQGRPPRG